MRYGAKIYSFFINSKKNLGFILSESDQEASTSLNGESWVAVTQLALMWLHMLSQKQAVRLNFSGGKTVSNAVEHLCHVLVCN